MMEKIMNHIAQGVLGTPSDLGIPERSASGAELSQFLDQVYYIAGVIAVIVIVIAAIVYASSGGDLNKVVKAKRMLIYAVIGLIFIIGAFGITRFIIGRIG